MWLRPMAAAKFAELAPLLIKRGILTKFTKDLLANVCMHWELVVRCYHRVSRDGPLVKNSRGMTVKHPALQIVRDHSKAIRDGLFRLGMTPIDMEKVGGVDANEDAEAAAFFGIR